MSNKTAGMVKELRSSTESDEFDLGGMTSEQAHALVKASFGEKLPTAGMVRFTFVVGGGKGCRQKYRDDLTKDLCEALRGIGFEEDRAASCSLACQGSYKHQHDTDKNLKFLHVFPNVTPKTKEEAQKEEAKESAEVTPEMLCAQASVDTYQRMVSVRAVSFAQKRVLLKKLSGMMTEFKTLEAKMMNRDPLSEEMMERYELLGEAELVDKTTWLKAELETMLADGDLTKGEKTMVLGQLEPKLVQLETAVEEAKEGSKKKAGLEKQVEIVTAKLEQARAINPITRPGKHDREIAILRKKLADFDKIEAKKQKTKSDIDKLLSRESFELKLAKLLAEDKSWFRGAIKK